MADALAQARNSALCRAFNWQFEVDGLTVHVGMRPRTRTDVSYLLRASFDDFPRHAPSCLFVNPQTRVSDGNSWPPGVRHDGPPAGICTPGTREFHDYYHANDRQYVWNPESYPFLTTLAEINRLLERGVGN